MRSVYFTALFLLLSYFGFGQKFQIPDSLKNKSFEELESLAKENYRDSLKFKIYSKTLLANAKEKNDPLMLARGYNSIAFLHDNKLTIKLAYLDSSLLMSKKVVDDKYPTVVYTNLGALYSSLGLYDKALNNYLLAIHADNKNNNKGFYYYANKHNVARMKLKIEEYEEAAKMFKEVLLYEKNTNKLGQYHLRTLVNLSETYRKLKLYDSVTFYNKIGIEESLKDSLPNYYYFLLSEGINLYYKKDYRSSLDSLNKAMVVMKDYGLRNEYIVRGYLYLSILYKKKNNNEKSIKYLKEIDLYHDKDEYVCVEMRRGYEMLINYYKSTGDKNDQLYYTNKLIKVDSLLDKQYKNLNKKITKEYDTPNLLREKEELIASLEAEKGTSAKTIAIISLLLILSMGGVSYYYYNQRRYKKRFLQLVETNAQQNKSKEKPQKNKTEISSINPETLEHLLSQLQQFEERQGYLSSKINSRDLAKSFGSNSSYLSLVINTYKEKSLSQYLNDLRIDFAVEKLQSDARFRKYTIKAIAQEVGFKTAEAFAKKFYKKTGIYPSYFIKKLEKQSSGTST